MLREAFHADVNTYWNYSWVSQFDATSSSSEHLNIIPQAYHANTYIAKAVGRL